MGVAVQNLHITLHYIDHYTYYCFDCFTDTKTHSSIFDRKLFFLKKSFFAISLSSSSSYQIIPAVSLQITFTDANNNGGSETYRSFGGTNLGNVKFPEMTSLLRLSSVIIIQTVVMTSLLPNSLKSS